MGEMLPRVQGGRFKGKGLELGAETTVQMDFNTVGPMNQCNAQS